MREKIDENVKEQEEMSRRQERQQQHGCPIPPQPILPDLQHLREMAATMDKIAPTNAHLKPLDLPRAGRWQESARQYTP